MKPVLFGGRMTIALLVTVLAALLASGCASVGQSNPDDPLEGYNRAVFSFNEEVDRLVLKPTASLYDTITPHPLHLAISNVFSNLGDIWIGVNSALQGKVEETLSDGMRLLVNTLLGFGGILDIASEMGLTKHDEDFGQTLGRWGVGEGPYFVVPFFGPRTLRDAVALPVDLTGDNVWAIQHIPTRNATVAVRLIDERARFLGTERTLDEGTLDKYSYVRDFYLQQRRYKVFDGNVPREYENFDDPQESPQSAIPPGGEFDATARIAVERLELLEIGGNDWILAANVSSRSSPSPTIKQ